jgi:hypothetical protein
MSLLKKLTDYAKSPEVKAQAQDLAGKAKQFATDPKRKEEFDSVKRKVNEKLGKDEPAKPAADADVHADAGAPKPDADAGGYKPPA